MRMDKKGGMIGDTFTKFPALIILLFILILYIIVSTFIVRDKLDSYSLLEDLLDDYIVYGSEIGTVKDLSLKYCLMYGQDPNDYRINKDLREKIIEHFKEKYNGRIVIARMSSAYRSNIYEIEGFSNLDGDDKYMEDVVFGEYDNTEYVKLCQGKGLVYTNLYVSDGGISNE